MTLARKFVRNATTARLKAALVPALASEVSSTRLGPPQGPDLAVGPIVSVYTVEESGIEDVGKGPQVYDRPLGLEVHAWAREKKGLDLADTLDELAAVIEAEVEELIRFGAAPEIDTMGHRLEGVSIEYGDEGKFRGAELVIRWLLVYRLEYAEAAAATLNKWRGATVDMDLVPADDVVDASTELAIPTL